MTQTYNFQDKIIYQVSNNSMIVVIDSLSTEYDILLDCEFYNHIELSKSLRDCET